MSIQTKAIERAIELLHAAKADFCIKHDGQLFGNLKPQEETIKAKRVIKHTFIDLYREALEKMQPGDVNRWTFDREKAEAFRSSLTGSASQKLGNDSYMTTVTKTSVGMSDVEIMRIK